MSYFIRNGNRFGVASEEALDIHQKLPAGNYTVKFDKMAGSFFLEIVDSFKQVPRVYGDTLKNADRVIKTFFDRPNSTGIMLTGEKGSGKTLLAKTLSIELAKQDVPTLIINEPHVGDTFNKFLQDIEQPCVVLFDEFEKVYDKDDQEKALTLLDGVFPSRKLFIITCNDKWRVNEHMRNRPGRIYYMLDFNGLSVEFIEEYCRENLKKVEYIHKVCQISSLFDKFNFDMLQALVEEMNRFGETPQEAIKMLNTKPEFNGRSSFDIELIDEGHIVTKKELDSNTWRGNPLVDRIEIFYTNSETEEWKELRFEARHLKEVDYRAGRFVFQNDRDQRVTLMREKAYKHDYFAF